MKEQVRVIESQLQILASIRLSFIEQELSTIDPINRQVLNDSEIEHLANKIARLKNLKEELRSVISLLTQ